MKEHQKNWTFATVSKVSDIENEWWSMGKKLFKVFLLIQERFVGNICLTSLTRAKCGTRSTLCWKVGNISGSTELFAL